MQSTTAGSKEARQLEQVKKAFEEAYRATTKTDGKVSSDTKYSISETTDGRFVAVVENDILSNISTDNWDKATKKQVQKAASKELKKFADGFTINGIEFIGNKATRDEYTRSNYSEALADKNPSAYLDKMRATAVLDDVIQVATDWKNDGELKYSRDDYVDFVRGNTLIKSGDSTYRAVVLAGITSDGKAIFHDVVDINPESFEIKKPESYTADSANELPNAILKDSGTDTVTQDAPGVNRQLSLSDPNSSLDDLTPTRGDLHISGKDVAIDFGPVREDLVTSQTGSALEGVPIGGEVEQDVLDSEQGAEYNNNRGDTYARTDEFRRLQEESQRMSDEEVQEYHSGRELDPEVRGRLSRAFKLELRSGGSKRNYSIRSLLNPKTNKTVGLIENVDGSLFHDVFEMAQKYLEDVHGIETTEEGIGYNDCYNYLSEDGLSGFSITPDGDLISVFNLSGERGFLKTIAPIVKERAKTLDCYASPKQNLQKMYEAIFGFKTASIMDYNMEYDHDNIADNHDMPQVAFMVNTEDNVVPHSFTKDQYDEAVEYRNSFINGATTQMAATSAGGLQASQIAHGKKTSSKDGVIFSEGLPQQKSGLPMDPNRAVDVELVFDGRKERRWVKTSTESDVVDGKVLQEDLDPVLTTYQPISNKATVEKAPK